MTEPPPSPLRKFADFVREQRARLTAQWMKAVFGDVDLFEADKLTYQQLADHLPEILEGLCLALDVEDLERVEPAIESDARKHGMVRWRQGYRIEELVRELDLFHQVLADALEEFAEPGQHFHAPPRRPGAAPGRRNTQHGHAHVDQGGGQRTGPQDR